MTASEKLKALEAAMTDAPWTPSSSEYEAVPYFVWDYYLGDEDADGVVALRNALPQIEAGIELLERIRQWDIVAGPGLSKGEFTADAPYWRGEIDAALAALEETLT